MVDSLISAERLRNLVPLNTLAITLILTLHIASADDRSNLLLKFSSAKNVVEKEHLLNEIIRDPNAGFDLLLIARTSRDTTTKWMAIRGIGFLKYREAVPFLVKWLGHFHYGVRANAARALGEIRESSASSALINLLKHERNGGVIEQTSLALQWIKATEAVPVLKKVASHKSIQTRCWVLQAIGTLGAKPDLPFVAQFLYDSSVSVEMCAAKAIEAITREDFGFPDQGGPMNPQTGINRAREWWEANKARFNPHE